MGIWCMFLPFSSSISRKRQKQPLLATGPEPQPQLGLLVGLLQTPCWQQHNSRARLFCCQFSSSGNAGCLLACATVHAPPPPQSTKKLCSFLGERVWRMNIGSAGRARPGWCAVSLLVAEWWAGRCWWVLVSTVGGWRSSSIVGCAPHLPAAFSYLAHRPPA
jgi:hypothetical protein